MARTVTKGEDGFFRVSGMDADAYFFDEHTAQRVAHNLNNADSVAAAEAALDQAEHLNENPPDCDVVDPA